VSIAARQARIDDLLGEQALDGLLVTDLVNVRYLCGFTGSNGVLVAMPGRRVLLTDSRYTVAARGQVHDTEVVIAGRDLMDRLAEVVPTGRIGIEAEHVSVARRDRLADRLDGVELVPTSGLVEGLRVVKDPAEIELIREATRIADAALGRLVEEGFAGRTEAEVAWTLQGWMRDLGATGASFDIIVAAGAHGALPHAVPRGERIPADTLVVVDMGARYGGYASDCTRTLATGTLPPALGEAYAVCLEAQRAALAACRSGVHTGDLDRLARGIITDAGLGEHFGHGLGHGVGLDIHERPWLRQEGGEVLQTGMVVTIEPGIYLEGVGGVRIEDLAIVTDDGCEVLTSVPTDLITTST
jgi:Xaa-Pro aminopeptidase